MTTTIEMERAPQCLGVTGKREFCSRPACAGHLYCNSHIYQDDPAYDDLKNEARIGLRTVICPRGSSMNFQTGRLHKSRRRYRKLPVLMGTDTIDRSLLDYKVIPKGTVLYRGDMGMTDYCSMPDLFYLTSSKETAKNYSWNYEDADYMRSRGKKFIVKGTVLTAFTVGVEIRLPRLDTINNITIFREYFTQYDGMYSKERFASTKSPFYGAFDIKDDQILRFSDIARDFWIFGILSQLGFSGYYADRLKFPKWLSKTEWLGEEIAISHPHEYISDCTHEYIDKTMPTHHYY
uniref:Uncharacterized protein n=1 Tax=viral metagenome TaxID=1070528 RepID=A0A6C0LYT5_9ZZZZ